MGKSLEIRLLLNGEKRTLTVEPDENLASLLRRLGCFSVKTGCDTGNCGACTVHLNGEAVLSCVVLAIKADGAEVTTIEGRKKDAGRVGALLIEEGADQCGYCSAGLIMSILYLESKVENPTDEEIKIYTNGNLCRCTGYEGQLRAIRRYFEVKRYERQQH